MGFIKYSVVELGVEEDVPGWIKQAKEVEPTAVVEARAEPVSEESAPANKKAEEQEENSIKDK